MFQSTTYGSSRVPDPGYEESSVKAGTPLTSTSFFSRHLVLSSCSAQVRCDIGEVRPTTSWYHADNYTWSFYRFQVLGDFVGEQADGREFTLDTVTIAWWPSESAFILPASWVPEKPEPQLTGGLGCQHSNNARNVVNLFSQLYHELTPLLLMSSSPFSSVKTVVMVVYWCVHVHVLLDRWSKTLL